MGNPRWPEPPSAGELVRLPVPCPPMLLEAIGYELGARYIGVGGSAAERGALLWADGTTTGSAWWPAWLTLTLDHPLGQAVFGPYDFGDPYESPAADAAHWLLVDDWEGTLQVGLARDVEALLAAQASRLDAESGEPRTEVRHTLRCRHVEDPAADPSLTDIQRELLRRALLVTELRVWLDDLRAWIADVAGGNRR